MASRLRGAPYARIELALIPAARMSGSSATIVASALTSSPPRTRDAASRARTVVVLIPYVLASFAALRAVAHNWESRSSANTLLLLLLLLLSDIVSVPFALPPYRPCGIGSTVGTLPYARMTYNLEIIN